MNAVIVVDMQNDFVDGSLAVIGAADIIQQINFLVGATSGLKVFTRDQHPAQTAHFDKWPVHCVAGTSGAEFAPGLHIPDGAVIVNKGMSAQDDGYSAFDGTDLEHILREKGVDHLFVCGIAFDYCVKATALDGIRAGFDVTVIGDACAVISRRQMIAAMWELSDAGVAVDFQNKGRRN